MSSRTWTVAWTVLMGVVGCTGNDGNFVTDDTVDAGLAPPPPPRPAPSPPPVAAPPSTPAAAPSASPPPTAAPPPPTAAAPPPVAAPPHASQDAEREARRALDLADSTDFFFARARGRLYLAAVLALAGREEESAALVGDGFAILEAKGDRTGYVWAEKVLDPG